MEVKMGWVVFIAAIAVAVGVYFWLKNKGVDLGNDDDNAYGM